MTYEELLILTEDIPVKIKEKPLKANSGRIKGGKIAIKEDMTDTEKVCTLAEELGHYKTTAGNIINQEIISNRKQELRARICGYNILIGIDGLINGYEHGCKSLSELAAYLNVTEKYLVECLDAYRTRYGMVLKYDEYTLYFNNYLTITKKLI